MSAIGAKTKEHLQLHRDGSICAKGQTLDGQPTGYWEWFRLDGTKLRSGFFESGNQVGTWTTYDKEGKVYKVTQMKSKSQQLNGKTGPEPNGETKDAA